MWRPLSTDRSQQALSNQYHFNIKVHLHPSENPKKPKKKSEKLKEILKNVKEFVQTHSPMWRPISIDRSRRALSNGYIFMLSIRFRRAETSQKPPNLPILHQNPQGFA